MEMTKGYEFSYTVQRSGFLPWEKLSSIFADAAAWLEAHPDYDTECAICTATDRFSDRVSSVARFAFRDAYGAWTGDDEGVMMLCFAAAVAETGDL